MMDKANESLVKYNKQITKAILYAFLTLGALVVLFPLFWMILTAFKVSGTAFKLHFFPNAGEKLYTFENFSKVLSEFSFMKYFFNSIIVASLAAIFATAFSCMAGYVFAKKEFIFKEYLFYLLVATMMIPGMMYLVPQFVITIKLGWFDTYQGLIIPHLANIFGVFMMRQFMRSIPDSLIEAARLDGASEWQIFTIIIVPLAMPIIVTLLLLTFLFHWSNFIWQLVITKPGSSILTLPVGLAYFSGPHGSEWEMMMAASCFSIIPIAVLFLVAQNFFIEGMTKGAVKE
ncbi:MAG TPA: carbohydrate ABC transporter permease [Candidatus Wallbacteria bacterium]|nr:carbohydrate ABC transporter permease [Candidatus Wallbacteria bacterium]